MTKDEAAHEKHLEFARRSASGMRELFPYMPVNTEIWEALQVVLGDPNGPKSAELKSIHAKRIRGDNRVETMRIDPAVSAEQITALRWEDV